MKLIDEVFLINKKNFLLRIHEVMKPEYIFVTHHGMLSDRTSFRYFEKWIAEKSTVVSFDARGNGDSALKASRCYQTYANDLKDVIMFVRKRYPNKKIILVASSWGSNVAFDFVKKYQMLVEKVVCWSVPFSPFKSENILKNQEKPFKTVVENNLNETKPSNAKKWNYALKFVIMLLFNINTSIVAKIDIERTANNQVLSRLNKISKPSKQSTRLFWAAFRSISHTHKVMAKINDKATECKVLYIQSKQDTYLKKDSLRKLSKNTGKSIKLLLLEKRAHALQWEVVDDLHIRTFEMIYKWIKDDSINVSL